MDWEAECIIRLCSNGSTLVSNVTFLEKVGLGNLLPSFHLFFCWVKSNLLRHQRGDDIDIEAYILSIHPVAFEISVHISIFVSIDHQIVKCKITGQRSFCSFFWELNINDILKMLGQGQSDVSINFEFILWVSFKTAVECHLRKFIQLCNSKRESFTPSFPILLQWSVVYMLNQLESVSYPGERYPFPSQPPARDRPKSFFFFFPCSGVKGIMAWRPRSHNFRQSSNSFCPGILDLSIMDYTIFYWVYVNYPSICSGQCKVGGMGMMEGRGTEKRERKRKESEWDLEWGLTCSDSQLPESSSRTKRVWLYAT